MKKQRHRFLLINIGKGSCAVSANFCECVVAGWKKKNEWVGKGREIKG